MCGRYTLFSKPEAIDTFFELEESTELPPSQNDDLFGAPPILHPLPSYNISPTHVVPIILAAPETNTQSRIRTAMHWGFMGWKPKANERPFLPINTRSEQLLDKPMWRKASTQRCLVPINGFYEWAGTKGHKTPHYIHSTTDDLLVAAGLYSPLSPIPGYASFSILTTRPNSVMEPIHHRMPVFLHATEWDNWLDRKLPLNDLRYLMDPFPDDAISEYIVGTSVGNVRNNSPELIRPS
ncbi:MAG: SOS response-associated peptidase [Bacteroidota bacterium]